MAQKKQSDGSDQRWLASLIATFEDVSSTEVRSVPCSRALLRAVRAHLAAPKAPIKAAPTRRFPHAA